jgi:serine/threonine protein kinase
VTSPAAKARIIGRYALYGELASGGMATVHFGRLLGPVGFSRTVAIKRLHPQFAKDPEFVSMFLDEARLAARIRHPNVVPTLDVVATQGELFLVMEYVQGESLGRLVRGARTAQAIAPRIVASILSGALHGLHAAHEAQNERGEPLGIVHRDVSPQNVLVGIDGVARVLDFGVAKASGRARTTRNGQVKGKLAYMPPEQLRGGVVTRSSDVYAAAVVLWETLTLQRLFGADNEGAIVAKILDSRVPRPSEIVPGLSPELDAVVMRGLDRDMSKRFSTAREMGLALERAVQLAPPSEVGEWVEANAGHRLLERADCIAEIESASSTNPMAHVTYDVADADGATRVTSESGATSQDMIPIDVDGEPTPPSQLSSISVSTSGVPALEEIPGGARGRRLLWMIASGAVVATLAALLFASLSTPPPERASARGATSDAPLPTGPGATPTGADSATTAAPTVASITPAAPSSSPAPAVVQPPSVVRHAPAHAVSPVSASCDPPYTLDAVGHKHYKVECL